MMPILNRACQMTFSMCAAALLATAGNGHAQVTGLVGAFDFGASAPTPGSADQYSLTGTTQDTGNYIDNQRPGQSFTTGSNPQGYLLNGVYLKERSGSAGSGGNGLNFYNLRIYSMTNANAGQAVLLTQYVTTNQMSFTEGDWIRFSGQTNILAPNTAYAFSVNRNGGGGWWTPAADSTQPYAAGKAGNYPTGSGTPGYASYDLAFDASMAAIPDPYALATTITPANPVYIGQTATLTSASFFGTGTLTFDWQTDSGSSGATWSDLGGSTTNTYSLNTTGMSAGTYQFRLILTSSGGSFTNTPATMNLQTPTVPGGTVAISPSATVAVGYDVTMTASLTGTPTIGGYQWQLSDNATFTNNISGATSLTYTINNAVATNSGYYRLAATNFVGAGATAFAQFTVTNTGSALVIDTGANNPPTNSTDIVQLSISGNTQSPGGLNYYWQDNTPAPGESFTTGANAAGYFLPAMYYKILGAASGGTYTLRIYSLDSANSNNATLLTTYQTTYTGAATVSGDWMKWIGLTNVFAPNATYAYSVQGARMEIYNASGNPYTGGRLALIALAGGAGSVNYGTSSDFDGTFVLKLSSISATPAVALDTTVTPASAVAGSVVTASATFTGLSPLAFQWQVSDLATYTNNVAGATNSSLTFYDVATTNAGYYRLVCTNSSGSAISSFAQLTVSPLTDVEILNVGGAPAASGYDIAQLSTAGNVANPAGLNYYDNNGTPPGQTFTTGSDPYGYTFSSLYIGMGNDGSHVSGVVYTLRLYSVFGGNATLISTYVNNNTAPAIGSGSWTKWIGLTNLLSPLTTYAYTISAGGGFLRVGNTTNNPYAGGQVCLIPAAGGTANYGNSSSSDGAFLVHLGAGPVVPDFGPTLTDNTTITPSGVFVGGTATMVAGFTGIPLPTYQWMFDNGSGAVAITGATNSTFTLSNAQLTNTGGYYLVASNNPNGSPSTLASSAAQFLVAVPPQTNTTLVSIADGPVYTSAPTPGSNDVAQITGGYGYGWIAPSVVSNLNYFVDNTVGQTFTTGNTPPTGAGYPLTSISLVQELNSIAGGLSGVPESYTLGIYKMVGSNAVLLTSYQTVNTLTRTLNGTTDGYWIVLAGLTNMLSPNTTYAFSIKNNGSGYWKLANDQDGNSVTDFYVGGQAAGFPTSGIGAVSYSTDPNVDAAFVVGLTPLACPTVLTDTTITPASALIQQAVSMSATFNGATPIYYQWQFDGGSGWVNIPGATNHTYSIASVNTTNAGQYQLFASNVVCTATSTAATLTVLNPTTFVANYSYQISYSGVGALPGGTGYYWNLMNGLGASTTSWADDGTTGVGVTFNAQRIANFTSGATTIGLFQNYLLIQVTTNLSFSFSNLPAGGYNVALYSDNGAYHGSQTTFVIGNVTNTAISTSDSAFILNNNYVVFTNILVTNGVLRGTYGRVTGESALNGAQLQMAYSLPNPVINIFGQPADVSVPVGNPASVSVTAYAPGQVFYQWWINGGGAISGATNSTYSPNTSVVGTNSYYVVITNSTGLSAVVSTVGTIGVYLPDTLSWRGIDGISPTAWDLSVLNWSNTVSLVDGVAYDSAKYVLFDDTAASYTVSADTALTPIKVTVNANNNYLFVNGAGSLSGAMTLTKTGNGTLTIEDYDTYTGGTTVNGGVLALAAGGGSGSIQGTLNINPGATVNLTAWDALGYNAGACVSVVNIYGGTLTNSGGNEGYRTVFNLMGGTMSSSLNGYNMYPPGGAAINSLATNVASTISGNIILRGNGLTITTAAGSVPGGIDLSISGVIDNGGNGLTKSGNGTLSLSGVNGYNNDLTISAGTLRIDGAGQLAGGNFSGVITNNGAFSYNSSALQTLSGVISGTGALTLNGNGTLRLNGVNTYSGLTTVGNGTLLVNGAVPGAATVTGGVLGGSGTIGGVVTIGSGGTLGAPGITTLTLSNSPVLGGTVVAEINRNGGSPLADLIRVVGNPVSYGGSLVVANIGAALQAGDAFTLFTATSYSGNFAATNLPSLGTGLGWSWNPASGTLSVIQTIKTNPPPTITFSFNGSTLTMGWSDPDDGYRGYTLQAQTNSLTVGLSTNWVNVQGSGSVTNEVITIDPSNPTVFYRLVYP
jgi:autotransporter-associated beta strand protein